MVSQSGNLKVKKEQKKKSLIKTENMEIDEKVKLGSKKIKVKTGEKEKPENIKVKGNKSGKRKGMEDEKENLGLKKIKTEPIKKEKDVSAVNATGGKTPKKNKKGKTNGVASPGKQTKGKNQQKSKAKINSDASPKGKKQQLKKKKNKKNKLSFVENEYMTRFEHLWVKKEAVSQLNDLRENLTEQGLSGEEIEKEMRRAKQKCFFELRRDLHSEKKKQMQGKGGVIKEEKPREFIAFEFQEDDLMTYYDGFWVLKKRVEYLDSVKEIKRQAILSSRTNGSTDRTLTEQEKKGFDKVLREKKYSEFCKLKKVLLKQIDEQNGESINRKKITDTPSGDHIKSEKSEGGDKSKDGKKKKSKNSKKLTEDDAMELEGDNVSNKNLNGGITKKKKAKNGNIKESKGKK